MNKNTLPKFIRWFIKSLIVSTFISLIIAYGLFVVFTDKSFAYFLSIFFFGFLISFSIFSILFVRLLYPLSKVVQNIKTLAKGRDIFPQEEDSFLKEPGEFYDLNKDLKQVSDYLKWQKEIINQESSELEAVISAVTGAILAIDKSKKVLFFNNQAIMLFSVNKKTSIKNIFLSEVIRSPDILKMYDDCLKENKIIRNTLSLHTLNIGEEVVYEITIAPLEKTDDDIGGAVGLFYDITNIKKTEKIHGDFISNVSHELRTPLTAIQGYVQTLLEELDLGQKDQIKKFLNIIRRNVERLVSLLNHFLELSRMEGSIKLKKEILSTEEITQSIVKDLHIKDHELKFNYEATKVKADKHFLKQVLYNLLDNAVRYVPKGRLIEVIWSQEPYHVVLTVRDQGRGISQEHKGRLFERFYRVDSARTGKKGGAGIGLSIVKKLMERHGGTIKVISEENQGSSFICTFPD